MACIIKEIESRSVAKRNHFLDRSSCSILTLVSIIIEQCQEESIISKQQVKVLLYICTNNVEKLQKLLCMKNHVSFANSAAFCKGLTPIHFAVLWDNTESLQVILKYVENIELINHKDSYSYTALHYAVQYSSTTAVRILLQHGADVNARLQFGHTSLHLAAYHVIPRLVLLLCQYGADVNAVNSSNETPLLMATRSGIRRDHLQLTTISLLLRYGASPNAHDELGRTPICYVSRFCEEDRCALMLCSAGAKFVFPPKEPFGSNSLIKNTSQESPMIRFRHFLEAVEKTPLRLEIICLIKVRETMGKSFQYNVQVLPLTSKLKKMLLFQALPKLV